MIFMVMECLFILLIIYTGTVLVEIALKMEVDCDVSIFVVDNFLFLSDAAQSKKSPFCKVTHWLERNEMAKVNTNI